MPNGGWDFNSIKKPRQQIGELAVKEGNEG